MICCAKKDTGRVRSMNEDSLYASPGRVGPLFNLFIVADGMGGHRAGDFASRFVVECIAGLVEDARDDSPVMILRRAIEQTNRRLYTESERNPDRAGMGSTVVAATIVDDTMYVANVGDSRLYLFRDGLCQITRDHSLVEEMVSRGRMTRDSESYQNQKNIITRAMGTRPGVEVDFFEVYLQKEDCILLCSDGLTNMVTDAEISRVLASSGTIEEKTESLIDIANANGGKDNIAVILVKPQISGVAP
ncbi:MAG: Stp1/IreP family PP2C-type Ser/Thr phosphatase [Lachnospiraceae bacterium]|nr:Stp1/IreP family PP2C-type Ser/Thr phosphatase [Lachnospiraceae bacterium]